MFRKNDQHRQTQLFSSIRQLPKKLLKRLENSWAGVFYREYFCRLDESKFAGLYSDEDSRPNTPVNVLVGLETLKAGFGWSDEEMYDAFCYNVQVRYALGYRELGEGHFELRTMYNFRRRLAEHMQATGENLIETAFEQITDEQIQVLQLKTGKLRMDSTQILSNIRQVTRLQLLVEVLQRVNRMLSENDQSRYESDFAPYLKGSSGQYVYHIKGKAYDEHLQQIGELMHKLVGTLSANYADELGFQLLKRVYAEHFVVEEDHLRTKAGEELSASSLQSPDDWEATYRQKRGEEYNGYVGNFTETCDPDNDLQLIVKVQVEPNTTDDAEMLNEALPELKERTDVDEMHTDGGFNSSDVDAAMHEHQIQHIQSAIRGGKSSPETLGMEDFHWETNAGGQPQAVTCPQGQTVDVIPGHKEDRYLAYFNTQTGCETCEFLKQCLTQALKRKAQRVLRFSQQQVNVALRRQRCAEARASGQNLRAAVEATCRSVKHPFRNGKVPVRGSPRVSMVVIGSAAMSNVRRIWRYLSTKNAEKVVQDEQNTSHETSVSLFFGRWMRNFVSQFFISRQLCMVEQ